MSQVLTGREPVSQAVRPPLIELAGLEKIYRTGKVEFAALRGVDLTIEDGEMVASHVGADRTRRRDPGIEGVLGLGGAVVGHTDAADQCLSLRPQPIR